MPRATIGSSALRVVHPRLGLLLQLLAPPVGQAELGRPSNPDGEDQEGSGQGGDEECDGHRYLAIGGEELDPHGAGVLHDEVDQSRAQHDGHADGYPGTAYARVAGPVRVRPPATTTPTPTSADCAYAGPVVDRRPRHVRTGGIGPPVVRREVIGGSCLDIGAGHPSSIPIGTGV